MTEEINQFGDSHKVPVVGEMCEDVIVEISGRVMKIETDHSGIEWCVLAVKFTKNGEEKYGHIRTPLAFCFLCDDEKKGGGK